MGTTNETPDIKNFVSNVNQYEEFISPYRSVMEQVTVRLNSLNKSFGTKRSHNPIHHFQSRIKSLESITGKLDRRGLDISLESAMDNLTDIAGLRVICYYECDVLLIVEAIKTQSDIMVVRESDYIRNPKPNGYKSYHLIIEMPLFVDGDKQYYPVEIQIRTLAMDFWASIEHELYYKLDKNKSKFVEETFLDYAHQLENIEKGMEEMSSIVNKPDSK